MNTSINLLAVVCTSFIMYPLFFLSKRILQIVEFVMNESVLKASGLSCNLWHKFEVHAEFYNTSCYTAG